MSTNIIDILTETDLYAILGVNYDSDISEINKKYKLLAKQYHPDTVTDQSEKEKFGKIFSKISSSYNTLKDPEKRKSYDYERKLKEEYQKTLNSTQFTFPNGGGITINITNINNTQSTKGQPQKGTPASQETKNEQAEKLYTSAIEKYQLGNVDAAILDLQTAIVLTKVAKYHSCLGLFMNEKGWAGYAQSHFKTALNIDPKDKIALKHINNSGSTTTATNDKSEIKQTKNTDTNTKENLSLFARIKKLFLKIIW